MKTQNKLTLLVAFCAFSLSANAAVISIDNMAPSATSVSGFTVSVAGTTTKTFTFTQTGDLDGGTTDDTLTFTLVYEAFTGSTFAAGDVTLGTASTPNTNNINWHNNTFTTGNTLSLSIGSVSYTDGEGDETIQFNGFTAINPTNYAGAPAGTIDYYVGLVGATTVTGDPTFVANLGGVTDLYFTAASGPVRLRNLDFSFETVPVPEPSSAALLGLGGLALLGRRNRA